MLCRECDAADLTFWVGALDGGFVTKSPFILGLLEGVDVPPQPGESAETITQRALDAQYLETKTDLGICCSTVLQPAFRLPAPRWMPITPPPSTLWRANFSCRWSVWWMIRS